jgi:UDPglucose 6-dehydrogenase
MRKTKIGIVGYGYVGRAMAEFFNGHYDVIINDPALSKSRVSTPDPATMAEINQCDVAVVCVPTPKTLEGPCDTSIVEAVVDQLRTPLILIKSTVSVGTCGRMAAKHASKIVFSPEYCGESSYWTPYDFHTEIKETPFFIFAGPPAATSAMVDLFLPVTGPVKRYIQTPNYRAAEMAKYLENTYYATKVAFCYEAAEICRAVGVDWNEARELWLADPRINPMHTAVFADNARPFGGKCLPKDLAGMIGASRDHGYEPCLLAEVEATNDRIARHRSK